MWNIQKIISKGDYNYVLVPEHPNATKNGYVLEHRVLIENKIERLLITDEVVHHIDLNPKNNVLDNLQLMTIEEHIKLHAELHRKEPLEFICPCCGITFMRRRNNRPEVKNSKLAFCSRSCNGKYYNTLHK